MDGVALSGRRCKAGSQTRPDCFAKRSWAKEKLGRPTFLDSATMRSARKPDRAASIAVASMMAVTLALSGTVARADDRSDRGQGTVAEAARSGIIGKVAPSG